MGLLFIQKEPICWGVWKIEETVEELLTYFHDKTVYTSFLEAKIKDFRKKEWLACRVLLNHLLGREITVAYHSNGAPYPEDCSCYISFSHTKGYVAVIIHPFSPVGIDIEYKGERILKVRDRFLSSEENEAVDPNHLVNHLLLYWCAKESMFKIMGEENVDFRESLHVRPFSYNTSGTFDTSESRTLHHKEYKMNYLVTEDFVLTYTVDKN